jgi:hypothetical protein
MNWARLEDQAAGESEEKMEDHISNVRAGGESGEKMEDHISNIRAAGESEEKMEYHISNIRAVGESGEKMEDHISPQLQIATTYFNINVQRGIHTITGPRKC